MTIGTGAAASSIIPSATGARRVSAPERRDNKSIAHNRTLTRRNAVIVAAESAFRWSKHARNNVRRLPLRACAVPGDGGPFARHRMQLLDLRQERLPASDRAAGAFELLSGADALTTYRFNTGTAQHTFCATCGIHPFYIPRSDPDKIDVNVRCLDGVDVSAIKLHAVRWQGLGARDGIEPGAVEMRR